MRIVIIAISFCEYVIQKANGLAALGHQVMAVMPASLIKNTVGDDINNLVHPSVQWFACTEERPWKLSYYVEPLRAVSLFSPDVLHIHENGELRTLALVLSYRHLPLVVTIHDVTTHPGADSKLKPRRRIIKRFLKQRADLIHLHGDNLCKDFRGLHPGLGDKVVVIPHGTLSLFNSWENEAIERDPLTCLFFGRMEKYRGLDNLVHIGRVLKKTVPDIKIIVAGKGSELQKYKAEMLTLGIFELHDGFIPNQDIFRYFRRASLLLLPYHEASQSGVVSMGFSFGIPVVATRVGSIPEVVIDGRHGKIVPPGDVDCFADAVRELLTDKAQLRRMAESCIKTSERLDFRVLANEFAELYTQAISFKNRSYQRGQCVKRT